MSETNKPFKTYVHHHGKEKKRKYQQNEQLQKLLKTHYH